MMQRLASKSRPVSNKSRLRRSRAILGRSGIARTIDPHASQTFVARTKSMILIIAANGIPSFIMYATIFTLVAWVIFNATGERHRKLTNESVLHLLSGVVGALLILGLELNSEHFLGTYTGIFLFGTFFALLFCISVEQERKRQQSRDAGIPPRRTRRGFSD